MKKIFATLAALACSLFAGFAQARREGPPRAFSELEMPSAATEEPMLPGDEIIVEVEIDGQGPYRFSLDTGAGDAGSINRPLAKALGLKVVGQAIVGDPSGRNDREVDIVEARTLAFGNATFKQVPLTVRDVPPNRRPADEDFDGMLGMRLFESLLLTLDYPARRVRIEKGELPPADGQEVLSFTDPHGVPQVVVKIGDLEIPADVDCGNVQGELVLPDSYLSKVPLLHEPVVVGRARTGFNEFDIRQAPLQGALRIGGLTIEGVRVDFVEIFPHANVGSGLLRRFVVSIDAKNQRIRFRRPAA